MRGRQIAGYRLVTELGTGGMGTVYFGEWSGSDAPEDGANRVAVKVLDPRLSENPDVVARFFDEARVVKAIGHSNIVRIFRFGEEQGLHFLIMELLEGETLAERIEREGALPIVEVRRVAQDICAALDASHAREVVHRDLKPENVFLTTSGTKVLDFGIAKLGDALRSSGKTQTGTVLGTPAYMSPEQCVGASGLTSASDIYSLAAMLYEMVSGDVPFTAESFGGFVLCHVRERPPPLPPGVPEPVRRAIFRGLEKQPEARFDSAGAFFRALCEVAPVTPVPVADPSVSIAAKLEDLMHKRIARGDLRLPSMPQTATRALALLRHPVDFKKVASTIERDPLIAGHLLRVASSPSFGGRNIQSLRQALPRFGIEPLREILMQLAARSVYRSHHPRIDDAFRRIWCHGVAVGNVSRAVAGQIGDVDRDAAYMAGLLHDVGKPVVGGFLLELERMGAAGKMDDGVWRRVVHRAGGPVGVLLSERWGLPQEVRRAIGQTAFLPGGAQTLSNIVRYANALVEREGLDLEPIDLTMAFDTAGSGRELLGLNASQERAALAALRENLESLAPSTTDDRTVGA